MQGFVPNKSLSAKPFPVLLPAILSGNQIVNEVNWMGLRWQVWQTALLTTFIAVVILIGVVLLIYYLVPKPKAEEKLVPDGTMIQTLKVKEI